MAAKVSPLEAVTGNTQQESSFRHAANTRRWHVEVALGIHHAKAKRRSYILMTGAFAICITLFLGFCTLVPFMENAFMPKEWSPELSIVSDTNTCSIPADRRDAVVQNSAVSRVFGRMFAYDVPAQISGAIHNSNLISYEENQFRWAQDQLIAGSIDTVTNTPGQVLFVANTGTEVQVGDTITLTINGKDQTVTVGGVLSDSLLARAEGTETLICSEETFSQLTGETGYTILDVQFRFGSDEEDVAEVEALFGEGVTFTDVLIQAQQQRGLYYAYGDIVILLDKRELFRKQEKIDLSFIEFEILHLLMRSPGRVFSKEQIYDIIWNEPYSGDYNVVMRHICNIREKIEDDPGHPVYIQTVRGVGYRFNGNLGSE
jgi:putative ABC transport system permease protein